MSLEQCVREITELCPDPLVHRAVQLIASGGAGNDDRANQLDAQIVLRCSWERVRYTETMPTFFEQLADIILSGPCAQGRTTRLMQFLL